MKLYRVMKSDVDGKPLVGDASMMLGLRPTDPNQLHKRSDVPAIIGTDLVLPGDGGLSCFSDPRAIAIQSKKLLLWSIESDDFPAALIEIPAGKPHYLIEPSRGMRLDELQLLLAGTRDLWQRA